MKKIKKLSLSEMNEINGGGPVFEGIAWALGVIHGALQRFAASIEIENDYDDVDWEKMRSKFE